MAKRTQKSNDVQTHFDFIFYLILVSSAILYVFLNPLFNTGVFNDDAVYVIGARSFFHPNAFHSLILKPDYPLPGLPMLLAPLAALLNPDWTALEWLSIVVMILLAFLVGKWARHWLTAGESIVVTALFAFNPLIAKFSGVIMPTPYYTFAAIVSFLLLEDLIDHPTTKKALALGAIAGWGSLIRPEGAVLLVGLFGTLMMTRAGRTILRVAVIPVIGWLLFLFYWLRLRQPPVSEYGSDVGALLVYWCQHFGSAVLFTGEFLRLFLVKSLTGFMLPAKPVFVVVLVLLAALFLVAVGTRSLWKRKDAHRFELIGMGLFCGLYSLVHLFWHVAVPRYMIPVMPFLMVVSVRGFNEAVSSFKWRKTAAVCALLFLGLGYATLDAQALHESLIEPNAMKGPPWRTLNWLDKNAPADAKVLSIIAPSVELYANRPTITGIKAFNIDMYLYLLRHWQLDYIVDRSVYSITPGVGDTEDINSIWKRMRAWITRYPQFFQLVFEDDEEKTKVYRVLDDPKQAPAYEKYRSAAEAYLNGREDEAFHSLQESLALDPALGSALNLLGGLYLKRNDFAAAERSFLKAIELMPDSPIAMINLATLYRLQGQTARSDEWIQRALQVGAINGDVGPLKVRLKALQELWERRQAILFMDPI